MQKEIEILERVRKLAYFIPRYWHTIYVSSMASATTVKVSRTTLNELERLRNQLKAHSLDEAIRALIQKHRAELLRKALGVDRGTIHPFTETDRGEDR
ncbi:MAG: VapB-type antitoxin [Candidatus Bathyarchaeia archaeon]